MKQRFSTACFDPLLKNPTAGIAGCCAGAESGHAAALPSAAMNSRRRIASPELRDEAS
jgi:hypothetical protein